MSSRPFASALAALAILAGCESTEGKPQNTVAPGAQASVATVENAARANPELQGFLAVVERVEPVAEQICRSQSSRRNCDFLILVDSRPGIPPNAFQTVDPQGRPVIAFTLALIRNARNADELAFVLSHEAAHHVAGHLQQQRENAARGAEAFGRLAGIGGRTSPEAVRTAQRLGAVVGVRTFSQEFELEADTLGTRIAVRSGFNPRVGAEFFFRIPDPGNRFLGSHPPNAARVAAVNEAALQLGL